MERGVLRVAFLVGSDSHSVRLSIERVCQVPGVEPVAVLVDSETPNFKRRLKNLSRNIRVNGWRYLFLRLLSALRAFTDHAAANAVVSHAEVMGVLRKAFPGRCFSLAKLGKTYAVAVHTVGNLNGAEAARVLSESHVDLGIVLGTRILKAGTFSIPRMGCINLHKGKVPDYRGMPPGFWELYDGASSAGLTVHFIDKGLDTGDVIDASEVPILPTETPDSLREKLHVEGARLLASAVSMIAGGATVRQPQGKSAIAPRTKPNTADIAVLRRKLPHWRQPRDSVALVRNLYLLFVFYSGLYSLVRWFHQRQKSRAAIYLYHRVNDYSRDVLTVDAETFAAQLLAISTRYPLCSTADLVEWVRSRKPIRPTTVAIHFDDCYRDIRTNGAPIMKVLGVPAAAFINSGFVDTGRSFPHDVAKYPFTYEMLRSSDVQEWARLGFEVGAHTVNHVDLGKCGLEEARVEILECGPSLQRILGKPIDFFSFPFGRIHNIGAPARQIVSTAGYTALFSAHGGFIGVGTDPYDIPRMGISGASSPLYVLLELEGLAPGQIASALRRIGSRLKAGSGPPST